METKTTTTYSMWSLFRNCRKACEWRYIQELVPLERDHNLAFGTVIHKCLEIWHGGRDLGPVLDFIDRTYPNRAQEEDQKRDWHLAAAMMKATRPAMRARNSMSSHSKRPSRGASSTRPPALHPEASCWPERWTASSGSATSIS